MRILVLVAVAAVFGLAARGAAVLGRTDGAFWLVFEMGVVLGVVGTRMFKDS